MEFQLSLSQEQRLQLTPELKQSLSILKMSSLELNEFIEHEFLDNPLIEWPNRDRWDGYAKAAGSRQASSNSEWWLNRNEPERLTLEEVLIEQLRYLLISDNLKAVCAYLIGNLDERGYLEIPLTAVSEMTGCCEKQVNEALGIVQSLEPAGVGARDLKECLLLQTARYGVHHPLISIIIESHLTEIADGKLPHVAKQLSIPIADIQCAVDQIRGLHPAPGSLYGAEKPKFVVPDIIVETAKEGFILLIEEQTAPSLKWDRFYLKMLEANASKSAYDFLKTKWDAARWLEKCIQQRKITLQRVAESVFSAQIPFLASGPNELLPLTMKTVAEQLGIHESTVSRAVNGKYVQTPWGLYELKYFFSGGVVQEDGKAASARLIKEKIRRWIDQEDKTRPLSDQAITNLIKKEGINVSRRTVAKYREEIGIPATPRRKRY